MTKQEKQITICIHIFRRDYRLHDNTTLLEACKTHDIVIPIFIFTHKQINPTENHFRSDNSIQFLCASLQDLNNQLHNGLYIYYSTKHYDNDSDDDNSEYSILEDLIKLIPNLKTISFNADYTKYAQERDARIHKICSTHNINCLTLDDICLNPPETILTTTGKVYTKFTPFWRASASKTIRKPILNKYNNYLNSRNTILINQISHILKKYKHYITMDTVMQPNGIILGNINKNIIVTGGRENGLKILDKISNWKHYDDEHDQLTYATTHLSAYNKFGCVSIREVYWCMVDKLGKDNGVVRQLFWRDFFYHLSAKFPEIYKDALNPKYRNIKWHTDTKQFKLWCEGKTGFPIVDACMRELNTTGYMHNRGRLIVSNFLCRLMHMDWHLGEQYFASKLVDYDPAQNNFGWQVSGANSSGTTSRPLEQTILNPWLQSSQFDKDGKYIKKWCPELETVTASDLHKWDITYSNWINKGVKYIKPILNYKDEKTKNLTMYRKYI
jgi:deoxyribodipyrimidine photo-lyase